MSVATVDGTPFVICFDEGPCPKSPDAYPDDAIVWSFWRNDGYWVSLPQFGIELRSDDIRTVVDRAVKRLLAYYDNLSSLDPSYINLVEEEQIRLIESVLAPWFARVMARNPNFWDAPSEMSSQFEHDVVPG